MADDVIVEALVELHFVYVRSQCVERLVEVDIRTAMRVLKGSLHEPAGARQGGRCFAQLHSTPREPVVSTNLRTTINTFIECIR